MSGSAGRRLLGAAGGLGWLPIAPGTWGSAGTIVLVGLVFGVEGVFDGLVAVDGPLAWGGVGLACVVVFVTGMAVGNHAETDWGRHDPGPFVLDEVVGQLLCVLPLLPGPASPLGLAVAFFAFRLFDVLKPPPCRRLETLPGGLGIMADDVAAGLYALVVVALVGL